MASITAFKSEDKVSSENLWSQRSFLCELPTFLFSVLSSPLVVIPTHTPCPVVQSHCSMNVVVFVFLYIHYFHSYEITFYPVTFPFLFLGSHIFLL